MRTRLFIKILVCIIFASTIYNAKIARGKTIRRFALVIGSNNGGPGREVLKYAVSDANSFASVLYKMGGVFEKDSLVLFEPDRRVFISSMNKFHRRIKNAKKGNNRVEAIFYYSGHSDEEGILLNREKINYKEIREAINKLKSDVKIAILDSCSSGAFTRTKGGKKKIPFLMDTAYDMKGYAFMTSSSSDEASQESDKIKGSFFTHFLVSGLRGAADMTQDGRITLNEAYQFAYNETLARTEKTMSGPQHPNYNIQMTGTGDVIMTVIRKSSAGLIMNRSVYGKFYIRDTDNILIAEFNKPYGRNIELGLAGGKYSVTNIRDGKLYEANVKIPEDDRLLLRSRDFKKRGKEITRARGDRDRGGSRDPAQKNEPGKKDYLVDDLKGLDHSGYGALTVGFSRIDDKSGVFVGAQGGWLVNNTFVLGIGGAGLATGLEGNDFSNSETTDDLTLRMGYGGLFLEYYLFPKYMYHVSFAAMIGAGGYSLNKETSEENEDNENKNGFNEAFFIFEPQVNIFIDITWFLRLGIGGTYRFVAGVNKYGYNDSDFRGFSGHILVALGWF